MGEWQNDNQNKATQRGEGSGREYKTQSSQHPAKVLTAKAQHANWSTTENIKPEKKMRSTSQTDYCEYPQRTVMVSIGQVNHIVNLVHTHTMWH